MGHPQSEGAWHALLLISASETCRTEACTQSKPWFESSDIFFINLPSLFLNPVVLLATILFHSSRFHILMFVMINMSLNGLKRLEITCPRGCPVPQFYQSLFCVQVVWAVSRKVGDASCTQGAAKIQVRVSVHCSLLG